MKKTIIFTILLLLFSINQAYAVSPVPENNIKGSVQVAPESDTEEINIIKKFSLKDKFKRSSESQIDSFFKKYNKYSMKNNIEKLKEMYDDNYVNNDGFNKETMFKMMEVSIDAYENVEYTTNLNKIKVNGNYAVVEAVEIAKGQTTKIIPSVKDKGDIYSEINYVHYLKKDGNAWKIIATNVETEYVSLKYGEAKNMPVEVSAPEYVAAGAEYDIDIKTSTPYSAFMVGAIDNEEIVFPIKQSKDIYRTVKSDALSRIVTSNENNHNEYATVSLAVTRAKLEPDAVVLDMTGMAFVMKRVNVLPVNKTIKLDEVNFNDKSE